MFLSSSGIGLNLSLQIGYSVIYYTLCPGVQSVLLAFHNHTYISLIPAGPIENCQNFGYFSIACFFVAIASTDFLFLTRVYAVYCHRKPIYIAFILLWIVDVGLLCLLFTGFEVIPIANTKHCINVSKNEYVAASLLVTILFDTMVYIFITNKLLSTRKPSEKKVTWRTIFSGESLPRLSYAIMQGGQ